MTLEIMLKKDLLKNPELISNISNKELKEILKKAKEKSEKQGRLINLNKKAKNKNVVFVGDIHGDFDALKKIIKKFLNKNNLIVFLGDYIDRGEKSEETLNLILYLFIKYPNIFLLMGNHEAYPIKKYYKAEFWEKVKKSKEMYLFYSRTFVNKKGKYLGRNPYTLRKRFGKDYFDMIMNNIKKDILIRGHDPRNKGIIFNKKCITLITSEHYKKIGKVKGRILAIKYKDKKINSTNDLEIEKI